MKKFRFTIHGNEYEVEIQGIEDNIARVEVNGTPYDVEIHRDLKVSKTPTLVRAEAPAPKGKETRIPKTPVRTTNVAVKSPLPGTIISVLVKVGDNVTMGQKLLTMEAMKMENNVLAEKAGTVSALLVKPGDTVLQNDVLVEIE
jgi:biotin carboxyl carrier protein